MKQSTKCLLLPPDSASGGTLGLLRAGVAKPAIVQACVQFMFPAVAVEALTPSISRAISLNPIYPRLRPDFPSRLVVVASSSGFGCRVIAGG